MVFGDHLYFTERNEGRVARVPVAGGLAVSLAQSTSPALVAVSSDRVFWTTNLWDNGTVYSVPNEDPPDGGQAPTVLASAQDNPFGIVADEQNVYWVASGGWSTATGALRTCPVTGCPPSGPISLAEDLPYPIDVAQDNDAVYVSVYGIDSASDGAVMKIAKP
jgi:hypothetical protein